MYSQLPKIYNKSVNNEGSDAKDDLPTLNTTSVWTVKSHQLVKATTALKPALSGQACDYGHRLPKHTSGWQCCLNVTCLTHHPPRRVPQMSAVRGHVISGKVKPRGKLSREEWLEEHLRASSEGDAGEREGGTEGGGQAGRQGQRYLRGNTHFKQEFFQHLMLKRHPCSWVR